LGHHFGQATDVGCVRTVNEDHCGVFAQGERRLFVVADGMGGEAGGRVASQTAVAAVASVFERAADLIPAAALRRCVETANLACLEAQQQSPDLRSMGTTLDLLLLEGHSAWWTHVGDGRQYRVHKRRATRLTTDHTRVQQMIADGVLTEKTAASHPDRHVLSRVVGRVGPVDAEESASPIDTRRRDTFVLCSDGLTDMVTDKEVGWIVGRSHPEEACRQLIALARQRGAPDNVTIQVVAMGRRRGAVTMLFRRVRSPLSPAARRRLMRVCRWAFIVLLALAGIAAAVWATAIAVRAEL
jgi:serine/threonine protein phosphatase PrpC